MEHVKLFWSRVNVRKMLRACEDNAQWEEVVFLYLHHDEFDNAALAMIAHPTEAWEHLKFKETISKLTNTEIFYKALTFYLEHAPMQINSILETMSARVDHVRVITQMKRAGHVALVKPYLLSTQPANIKVRGSSPTPFRT
eukprot:scaffold178837_cov31-Tisochrysis_lutea.AAC.10